MSPANGQQVKAGTRAGRKESSEAAEVAQEKGRGRISEGSGRLAEPGGGWWALAFNVCAQPREGSEQRAHLEQVFSESRPLCAEIAVYRGAPL